MIDTTSSSYKAAVWIANLPASYFLAGLVAALAGSQDPTPLATFSLTLIIWLSLCWLVQWEWSSLFARGRRYVAWMLAAESLVGMFALMGAIVQPTSNIYVALICLTIMVNLKSRMWFACLEEREQAAEYGFPLDSV